MHKIKVCVVSGSRAEFGQLLPLLLKLNQDSYFSLDFVVTGSHLYSQSGKTISEIEKYKLNISKTIPIPSFENNSKLGIAKQISELIDRFATYFNENTPDILIVIGDRYEIYAVGIAANTLLIPIVHICGGSTTSGAIDEIYRHSLSKMSKYHFTTCETYRKRVIQLGENPENVYNVGSLAIENCMHMNIATEEEFRDFVGLSPKEKYCVVTYHPITLEKESSEKAIFELIEALDFFKEYSYIITLSNADSGGKQINEIWTKEAKSRSHFHVFHSLGMRRYLTALKYSEMMIGNSSSGTTEGPAMHIPTIDIGDRQKGRFFAESIIHCDPNKYDIIKSINKANSIEFRQKLPYIKNPFGNGDTSAKIIQILKEITSQSIELKKDFFDISFEV